MKVSTESNKLYGKTVTIVGLAPDYENDKVAVYETSYSSSRNAILAAFRAEFGRGLDYPKTGHTCKKIMPIQTRIDALEVQLAELKREAANC